jgi:hypothetical protein
VPQNGLGVNLGSFGANSFNLFVAKPASGVYGSKDVDILSTWSLEICEQEAIYLIGGHENNFRKQNVGGPLTDSKIHPHFDNPARVRISVKRGSPRRGSSRGSILSNGPKAS